MKFLHTTDWHIGHTFYDFDRTWEHEQFLFWLEEEIVRQQIDVLLMTGDVFDVANPSAASQKMLYSFLRKVKHRQPHLQTIIIAGNHDSAARLEAPKALLEEFHTTIIGVVPRNEDRSIAYDSLLIPIKDSKGKCRAWCMAVPFLRLGDYPIQEWATNPYTEGVTAFYKELFDFAHSKRTENEAIIALGHLHATGAEVSDNDKSERAIIGGVEYIPAHAFHDDIAYTALGHIHKSQKVAKKENVRYAGSPLPMSFSEIHYKHRVITFEIEACKAINVQETEIPKSVSLLRVPQNHLPLEEVLQELALLEEKRTEVHLAPYLEVRVMLTGPEPSLKHKIETALQTKHVRLARIDISYPTSDKTVPSHTGQSEELHQLDPKEVFAKVYKARYQSDLPEDMARLFDETVQEIVLKESSK